MEEKQETQGNGNGEKATINTNEVSKRLAFIDLMESNHALWDLICELQEEGIDPLEALKIGRKHLKKSSGEKRIPQDLINVVYELQEAGIDPDDIKRELRKLIAKADSQKA